MPPTRRLQSGEVRRGRHERSATVSVPVTETIKARIEKRAIKDKMTMSEVVRRAIDAYL